MRIDEVKHSSTEALNGRRSNGFNNFFLINDQSCITKVISGSDSE